MEQEEQRGTMDGAALPIMKQSSAGHCAGQCITGRAMRPGSSTLQSTSRLTRGASQGCALQSRLTLILEAPHTLSRCHLPEVQRSTVTGAGGQRAPSSLQVPPAAPAAWTVPQPGLCPEQCCGQRNCLRTNLEVIGADSSADLGLGPEGRQGGGGREPLYTRDAVQCTHAACAPKQCSNSTLW